MRETRRNSGGTLISFPSPLSPLPIIIFYINLSSYKGERKDERKRKKR